MVEEGSRQQLLRETLRRPTPHRLWVAAEGIRHGLSVKEINKLSGIDLFFLGEVAKLVWAEEEIRQSGIPKGQIELLHYKKMGFSDARLAQLSGVSEGEVQSLRYQLGVRPVYKTVDTCAAEFESLTSYLYSCYEGDGFSSPECEASPSDRKKVVILGSGPNRIGQGIEFDYTCVHGAKGLSAMGYETILVNCNPETVSTDYDISDKLYFEPLSYEFVLELIQREQQRGQLLGVVVQFGGQTPLKLSQALKAADIPIIGTPPDSIDLAEDRERFQKLLFELGLKQPENDICHRIHDISSTIDRGLGYPVVIRPSNVLGGRAMAILQSRKDLDDYLREHRHVLMDGPILIDRFLDDAVEIDVDALCDGERVFVPGIMEHIERAGVHSGDSACVLPPLNLSPEILREIEKSTETLARAIGVVGLVNVQYAVKEGQLFVIEVNPRASRTTPFVAKATGVPVVAIASQIMAGKSLDDFALPSAPPPHYSVKEVALPFARFPHADILLGPEMRSTGEVMGWDRSFHQAFAKAQEAVMNKLPKRAQGVALVGYGEDSQNREEEVANSLRELGLEVLHIGELEGNALTELVQSGKVSFVACTDKSAQLKDFRRLLVEGRLTHFTTHEAVICALESMKVCRDKALTVAPIQAFEEGLS